MLIKEYGYFPDFPMEMNELFTLQKHKIESTTIMWAAIEIDGHVGYIVGNDTLLESLLEKGFRYERK